MAHAGKFVPSQRLLEAYREWADSDISMESFALPAKPILEDKGAYNHRRQIDGVRVKGYTFATLQDLQAEQPQHHEDGGHTHLKELQPCCKVVQQLQQQQHQQQQALQPGAAVRQQRPTGPDSIPASPTATPSAADSDVRVCGGPVCGRCWQVHDNTTLA